MKYPYLILAFIFLGVISCQEKVKNNQTFEVKWDEGQKWKYFQDSIAYRKYGSTIKKEDSLNNFSTFSRIMFAKIKSKYKSYASFYALEEPYIDTTKIDPQKFWIRILIIPTFGNPYCLVVERKNRRTYLTGKVGDGIGGYYPGLLDYENTNTFSDTLYSDISNELNNLNYWKLGVDSLCNGGDDGEIWIFEVIENGKYKAISRWSPLEYGDATSQHLACLGRDIEYLSGLFFPDIKAIETHRLKKKYGLRFFKKYSI